MLEEYVEGSGFMTTEGGTHYCSKVEYCSYDKSTFASKFPAKLIETKHGFDILRHPEGIIIAEKDKFVIFWTHSNGDPVGLPIWLYIAQDCLISMGAAKTNNIPLHSGSVLKSAKIISKVYVRHLSKMLTSSKFQMSEKKGKEALACCA